MAAPSGPASTGAARSVWPAAIASVLGWAFDLFDLFLLLYVAGPVGRQIFPAHSETLSLALVFASFAVSVVMRPGGAALFGQLADRVGRRRIMVAVLAGVGLSTAAMGLVPTYAAAGVVGPILFLVLRITQGVFVGGVSATTHTIGTESVPERWRGTMGGMIGGVGAGLGAAMASICFVVVSRLFPGDSFDETGWRVLFFCGLLGALLSLFVLRKVEESPLWRDAAAEPAPANRFSDLVRGPMWRVSALNLAVAAGAGTMYYLTSGFLPTLLDAVVDVPAAPRGNILLVSSLGVMAAALGAGSLSQRVGRRPVLLAVGALNVVALPLLTWGLVSVDAGQTGLVTLLAFCLALLGNASCGVVLIFLNERYPTRLRSRGTAVIWNTGFMLGGLTPTFVNLLSPAVSDIATRVMAFLVVAALVFVAASFASPETRGNLESYASRSSKP